jgi:ADP-ribosyl-[dinitrogen reductase] hydrolase
MICSSVNLVRFIVRPLQGPDSNRSWRKIRGAGHLEAALWSVGRSGSFAEAVLTAANLGEDADTTAAIAAQLAGAIWGADAIPQTWRERLAWCPRIRGMAEGLI